MKEPTEAQIEELWEWCGFYDVEDGVPPPIGTPPIDLNNLFKYAVPKTIKSIAKMFEESEADAYDRLFDWWAEIVAENPDKPDLALFQVLELQAKEEKSNE